MKNKVIWSEGMFLQPQHFQQQESYLEYLISEKTTGQQDNAWGIAELSINEECLSLSKISVNRIKGVFADGTTFNAPIIDSLPTPITISENAQEDIIYLAIPLKQAGLATISLNDNPDGPRYHSHTADRHDDIKDAEQNAEIRIAKLSPKLMLESEERSEYSCIPIAKIKEVRSNGTVVLEADYLTPVINTRACVVLTDFITEIHSLLQHRADMIAFRLTHNQQSTSAELADFMLLQLINRFEPLFSHLGHRSHLHPEELYIYAIQLLGEMSTYTHDSRRAIAAPKYLHAQPNETFKPLIKMLRESFSMVLTQNAISIPLESKEFGLWIGDINDRSLLESANFILAVYTDDGPESVKQNFSSQIKIGAVEQIKELVSRALPGIELQPLAIAPRQIPYHANFSYFILNKQHEFWQSLTQSGGIAFHIGGHFPGIKCELWAIKG